jgi:hypothetical protein
MSTPPISDTDVLNAALRLREAGLSVLPINHRTKQPEMNLLPRNAEGKPVWTPYMQKAVDKATLRAWFAAGLKSFAIIGGAVSGNLLILDFDVERFYHAWLSLVGDLAEGLPVQRTGGGGHHVYLRCPKPGESVKLAFVPDDAQDSGRKTAIETKAERGYAVAPTSLHPDGTRYELLSGDLTQIPVVSQARADALLAAARKLDEMPHTRQEMQRIEQETADTHAKRARANRNGQTSVIEVFNERYAIEGILEYYRYTKGRGGRYIRPGGESESVSVKEGRSCHWSSDDPLNDGKVRSGMGCHDAFDVYCFYEHGNDVTKAVKAAAEMLQMPSPSLAECAAGGERINGSGAEPTHTIAVPPRKRPDWRPFPLSALPPVMQRFASESAQALCVDPSMTALPMMSIVGATIGNVARARMSADYHAPPNLWSAVVVRSGERKSPALRSVMAPIYCRQAERAEQHAQAVVAYQQDLERWKQRTRSERGDAPVEPGPFPHLYLSDTTTEAIAMRLSAQPRGLAVVLDELAGFFSAMNQYKRNGGNDRESYLAFYDAGPAKIDRKSSTPPTIFIPRAFVSVCGMIQPGALARALGPAEFDSGLAARFLLASPPPLRATWGGAELSEAARDGWRHLLFGLLDMPVPEQPALIPPSDAAMRVWAAAHDRLEAERHVEVDDRMRAARAKLIGAIPRAALVFQCVSAASGEKSASFRFIDELSMARAIELVEWFGRETVRVYGLLIQADDEDDIIRRIEANGGVVSPRELMHWSREFRGGVKVAESFLQELVEQGVGLWTWALQGGRGRPRKLFVLLAGNGNANGDGASANGNCVTVTTPTLSGNANANGQIGEGRA